MPWRRLLSETLDALHTRGSLWVFALIVGGVNALAPAPMTLPPSVPLSVKLGQSVLLAVIHMLVWGVVYAIAISAAIHTLTTSGGTWRDSLRFVWEFRGPLAGITLVIGGMMFMWSILVFGPLIAFAFLHIPGAAFELYIIWALALALVGLGLVLWAPWVYQACIQGRLDARTALARAWDVFVERLGTIVVVSLLAWLITTAISFALVILYGWIIAHELPSLAIGRNPWQGFTPTPLAWGGRVIDGTVTTAITWTLYTLAWPYMAQRQQPVYET